MEFEVKRSENKGLEDEIAAKKILGREGEPIRFIVKGVGETAASFNRETGYGYYARRVLIPNGLIDTKERMPVLHTPDVATSPSLYITIDPRGFLEISVGGIKGEKNFLKVARIVDRLAKDYKKLFSLS